MPIHPLKSMAQEYRRIASGATTFSGSSKSCTVKETYRIIPCPLFSRTRSNTSSRKFARSSPRTTRSPLTNLPSGAMTKLENQITVNSQTQTDTNGTLAARNSGGAGRDSVACEVTGIARLRWRRTQSRANLSLPEFPGNSEKCKELSKFSRALNREVKAVSRSFIGSSSTRGGYEF